MASRDNGSRHVIGAFIVDSSEHVLRRLIPSLNRFKRHKLWRPFVFKLRLYSLRLSRDLRRPNLWWKAIIKRVYQVKATDDFDISSFQSRKRNSTSSFILANGKFWLRRGDYKLHFWLARWLIKKLFHDIFCLEKMKEDVESQGEATGAGECFSKLTRGFTLSTWWTG